jgi:hypothetical protein
MRKNSQLKTINWLTVPCFNRLNNSFSIALSSWAATNAFSCESYLDENQNYYVVKHKTCLSPLFSSFNLPSQWHQLFPAQVKSRYMFYFCTELTFDAESAFLFGWGTGRFLCTSVCICGWGTWSSNNWNPANHLP